MRKQLNYGENEDQDYSRGRKDDYPSTYEGDSIISDKEVTRPYCICAIACLENKGLIVYSFLKLLFDLKNKEDQENTNNTFCFHFFFFFLHREQTGP